MLMGHSAQRGQLFDAVNLTRFGDLGQAQDRRLGIVWRVGRALAEVLAQGLQAEFFASGVEPNHARTAGKKLRRGQFIIQNMRLGMTQDDLPRCAHASQRQSIRCRAGTDKEHLGRAVKGSLNRANGLLGPLIVAVGGGDTLIRLC